MKRYTKIVATVGPSCWDETVMRRLIQEGVDVFRLNFSHARHEQSAKIVEQIRRLSKETGRNVAILQDLQGPRIRTGQVATETGQVELVPGSKVTLTSRPVKATGPEEIGIDYPELPLDVTPGDTLLINDGLLELQVFGTTAEDVQCTVVTGGPLS